MVNLNSTFPLDYSLDGLGATLSDAKGRTIYLQGEDADPIRDLDAWLDGTEFPYGVFETMQDAINANLDEYFACRD